MRVAVLADCHLDHGHHGGRWATDAWDTAIDEAIESGVDALVLAGDVFHTGRPTAEALMRCAEGLRRVVESGAEAVYVTGNHEWSGVRTARSHRPPSAVMGEIQGVTAVTEAGVVRLRCGLAVACLPWPSPHRGHPYTAQTEDACRLADDCANIDGPVLGVAHSMVAGAALGSEATMAAWQPSETVGLAALDVPDAWERTVMGHVHARQQLSATCGYVGSLDCFTFADEGREGGWCSYTHDGWEWAEEWHRSGDTRFATLRSDETPDGLPEGCIVRVRLVDGSSTADYDERPLVEAGLHVAGYIHDETIDEAEAADPHEMTEEDLAELAPCALLDKWAEAKSLTATERTMLRDTAREVLDWR